MKRLLILLFMLTFCFSNISYASKFSSEDLVGNWNGCFMETTALNTTRVLKFASVVIAPTNYAVSGTWSDKGYSNSDPHSGNITGGSLNITAKGEITGSINIVDATTSVPDIISVINGWMDIDKNIFYIVTERPGGQLSMGMLVKYQHSLNSFSTSDLAGTWFVNNIQSTGNSSGNDDGDWVVNILTAAATGFCSGTWYSSGDSSGTIDSPDSSLSLNSSYGWVTGTLYNNLGSQINVYNGQMSSDKNVGNIFTNSDFQSSGGGNLTSGVFLRAGGTGFVSQDLKGTWAMYTTEVSNETDMYWFYGEITLDQSGKLIKGNWNSSEHTGTYTSGQINIENSGSLSGTITSNIGYTHTIKKGLLSQSKNHASLVLESTNKIDTGFIIKKSNNNILPAINLLIGD